MAEPVELRRDAAERALVMLRRARTDLERLAVAGAGNRLRRAIVVSASEELDRLARDPACAHVDSVLLQDWRDRLGSHVLVAEALGEMEVHPDLADQLLQRGLDEILEEAPGRSPGVTRVTAGD